ncbi:MAG: response regulator [Flavobacteriales bacterium]|nr:response regulator [Flavobacteriales bacterium]
MKQKLNCILLIDDDEPTNFINEIVIKKADCAEKVVTKQSAMQALEFLTSKENGLPTPDLILLDINMPVMSGWEFLEEYRALQGIQKGEIIIIMLTTSLNPRDQTMAESIKEISGFKHKPLIGEMLNEILSEHFADKL